jgi:hypothetical protein
MKGESTMVTHCFKSSLKIKSIFAQWLAPLFILGVAVLLVPGDLFAQGQTIAVGDSAITPPNTEVTIDVVANDTPGSGSLDLATITNTPPSNGAVVYNSDGTFTYTPNADFSNTVPDTFDYTVCDTTTPTPSCATATVSIIVAVEAFFNVIPSKLNVTQMGVLPVELRSSEDFDVTTINPESLMLQGVAPLWWNMARKKLTLKFSAQGIVSNIGSVNNGDVVVLQLTGLDVNEVAIIGEDPVIIIKNKGKQKK